MTTEKTYNGWKNRATWNLVLWAENDYELYQWIRENKISLSKLFVFLFVLFVFLFVFYSFFKNEYLNILKP